VPRAQAIRVGQARVAEGEAPVRAITNERERDELLVPASYFRDLLPYFGIALLYERQHV
jgi:hypothetical protein